MPPRGRSAGLLVDTSVAVALVVADHKHHLEAADVLRGRELGLSGHAAFETFSVLTRLPGAARRGPATIARLLGDAFPMTCFLGSGAAASLAADLAGHGIAGGAVYDALVGACANEHHLTLATRDRRALDTYRALNVTVELLG